MQITTKLNLLNVQKIQFLMSAKISSDVVKSWIFPEETEHLHTEHLDELGDEWLQKLLEHSGQSVSYCH